MIKMLISLFFASFVMLFPVSAYAQDNNTQATTPTPAIDYSLPYAGILPDSPFYTLKVVRDRIMGFFISGPLKKAEFDITRADARMAAALALVEQKKSVSLAQTTVSKAENYLEEAMGKVTQAKTQGMDIHDLVKRLALASQKYQQTIEQMQSEAAKSQKNKLETVKQRIIVIRKAIDQIKP